MRVLHVLDHSIPLHSGYTFRTLSILREQRRLGWETHHLTSPKHPSTLADELVDGLRFFRTPAVGDSATSGVVSALAMMRRLESRLQQVVEELRPDVLHVHSPVLNALPALRIGRRFGLPVVYEVRAFWEDAAVDHGTTREGSLRYWLSRRIETYALRRADHVTTICDGLRRDIVARGIPSERVTVIPNAVDVDSFATAGVPDRALQSRLGLAGVPVIGFIGSFYAYEGLDLLIDALPQIAARVPDVKLLLVGGGPEQSALQDRVERSGQAGRVIFTGRVPHASVHQYYDLIDVLVYPRHSMRLTDLVTPLKPLEAMAQRRVLVASDVGGHRELIEDGKTGVLFRAGSAEALADAVARLLCDRTSWETMRDAGRRFVETERTWERSVAHYLPVFRRLVAAAAT